MLQLIRSIQPREWRWVTIWSGVIMAVLSLPYVIAVSLPDTNFGGFIIGVEDGNAYLAFMTEGEAGHWLFYSPFTAEPHDPALFFPHYLALGHLTRWLGTEGRVVLYIARLFSVAFELFSVYCFVAYFTPNIAIRRLAFLLFTLTAGFGWAWAISGLSTGLGTMPTDFWVPDHSFVLSALSSPHLPVVHGLLLWVMIAGLAFVNEGNPLDGFIAALAGLCASLIHTYKLGVPAAVLGLYVLWLMVQQRQILWRHLWRIGFVIMPSVPYVLYAYWVFETNFAFAGWREQNLALSPPPLLYLLGLGLLVPLALIGLSRVKTYDIRYISFLLVWVLLVPVLIYAPTEFQRRFLHGYQSPLVIFGAIGLLYLTDFVARRWRSMAIGGVIMLMSLTNILLIVGSVNSVLAQQPPMFLDDAHHQGFEWLAANAEGEVVLASYEIANTIVAHAPVRVFVGHVSLTLNSQAKSALVEQFFAADTTDAQRQAILAGHGIDYVFYGNAERQLGAFAPDAVPYLESVYANEAIQIYRVRLENLE